MPDSTTTDELIARVHAGDAAAESQLLDRHRDRIRRMIAVRMDRGLQQRFDPSDVIQDALAEAHRRLPRYVQQRQVAFYPWLRQIAWEKLVALHRHHAQAEKRTVYRERGIGTALNDESASLLVEQFATRSATPSERAVRRELQQRVHDVLAELSDVDREVIVLRHLEELTFRETAEVLSISESAVHSRYRRAVTHLHEKLS